MFHKFYISLLKINLKFIAISRSCIIENVHLNLLMRMPNCSEPEKTGRKKEGKNIFHVKPI